MLCSVVSGGFAVQLALLPMGVADFEHTVGLGLRFRVLGFRAFGLRVSGKLVCSGQRSFASVFSHMQDLVLAPFTTSRK